MTKKDRKRAAKAYTNGDVSLAGAAEMLGVSGSKARKILIEDGVEIRGRGRPKKA